MATPLKTPDPREARPSIGELFSTVSTKTSELVRAEIQLAKTELATKAKHAGTGLGLFAGAAFLGFFGFALIVTTLVLALANVVPAWLAALIVAVLLLALAAVLAVLGKKALDRGTPPTPTRAQTNVKRDVEAVKEGLRS